MQTKLSWFFLYILTQKTKLCTLKLCSKGTVSFIWSVRRKDTNWNWYLHSWLKWHRCNDQCRLFVMLWFHFYIKFFYDFRLNEVKEEKEFEGITYTCLFSAVFSATKCTQKASRQYSFHLIAKHRNATLVLIVVVGSLWKCEKNFIT